jgi:pimeloyl-ACP methyl ester carboxylesterase
MRKVVVLAGWCALLAVSGVLAGAAAAKEPVFVPGSCPVQFDPSLRVDCGVVTLPEDPGARLGGGRTVTLQVAVLRSPNPSPAKDPIVLLDGGPSFNEINPFTVSYLASLPLAANRDIVLYNERGVGYSTPRLGCPEFDQVRADAFASDPFFDGSPDQFLAAVTACRNRLAGEGIDLSAYGAEADASDMNALRVALGYKRCNLLAWSADGVVALTEMRLYPQGLRSVILDSPVGNQTELLNSAPDLIRNSNRVLEAIFAGCAANAACKTAYPNLRARFYARIDKLRRHPVVVDLPVAGGGTYALTVDADLIMSGASCPDPICAAGAPRILDEAASGDIAGFLDDSLGGPLGPPAPNDPFLSEGKSAVFHCRDYIAFEPDSELTQAAAELPEWRGILLGLRYAYVPLNSKQACATWNVGQADPAQHEPVRSAVPTLVLTGKWDGAIGPLEAERIAGHLTHAFLYEFPGTGHLATFWDLCPNTITTEFLDNPDKRPDSNCIASMHDVDFTPQP